MSKKIFSYYKSSMKLSNTDYITIVKHYGEKVPMTRKKRVHMRKTKKLAENILANKLCGCIKSVQKTNARLQESGAIAICNNIIFKNRGLKHYRFTCKKGNKLMNKVGSKTHLTKTRKNIQFLSKK